MQHIRKENQTLTSKKHDKRCIESPKEIPPQNENVEWLKDQLKLTNDLNDALLEEVKENEAAIKTLEAKEKKHLEAIKILENKLAKISSEKVLKSSECQTFSEEIQIPCEKCVHVSSCEEEYTWHLDEYHDIQTDSLFDSDFPCDVCAKQCRSKSDLDFHQQLYHI